MKTADFMKQKHVTQWKNERIIYYNEAEVNRISFRKLILSENGRRIMRRLGISRIILIMFMMFSMIISLLPVSILAEGGSTEWDAVAFTDIADGDTIAITMTKEDTSWILSNEATGAIPPAASAEITDGVLNASSGTYGWTFKAAEGGFTIAGPGGYLNSGGANNGLKANGAETVWTLDPESGYLRETATGRYLGVYNSQDWRTYTTLHINIKDQTLTLWKFTGEAQPDPEPTDDPEPTEEPVVTPVTIAEALAGATGTEFTVQGVVTMVDGRNIYVQDATGGICLYPDAADATVNLGDTLIGTGSRAVYRGLPELTGAILTKSEGLALSAKETTIDALTTADICTYVSLKDLEVTEVYDNNGAYTSPNITFKDEAGNLIQLYKAVIGKTGGSWDLAVGDKADLKAAVGVNNSTLQLRNTAASEIEKKSGEEPGPSDPEDPYEGIDPTLNVYELTTAPADGDRVVIYNAGSGKAVKAQLKGNYYLEGEDLSVENKLIATDAEKIEWTVKANEDGTFTFTQDEMYLAGKQTENGDRKYNNLTLSAEDGISWTLDECNAENSSWYISNPAMTSNYEADGGKVYLEWYANYTEFSLYDTSRISENAFGFGFYKLVREKTDGVKTPTASPESGEVEAGTTVTFSCATEGAVIYWSLDGETWTEGSTYTVNEDVKLYVRAVLEDKESQVAEFTYTIKAAAVEYLTKFTEAPADGDKVVIYHPSSGMAMTAAASGARLAGTAAAAADDKLEKNDEMAYMNVIAENDQYTFELDGKYLTSGQTGNSLTFADDASSDLAKWTLEQQADGTWYLMNVGANYNGNYNQALEYYNGFTTYGVKADNAAYKFEFYGAAAEETISPISDLSQLKDGSYVVIYNPANSVAMTSETYQDWYLYTGTPSIEEGKVIDPADNMVWKVNISEDGTYSFTQGTRAVAAWISGTYVELTSDPAHANASKEWKIKECNPETDTFYIYSADLSTTYGNAYIEAYYQNRVSAVVFCGYSTSEEKLTEAAYGMQFYPVDYKEPEVPEDKGDLVTDLSQLADGAEVVIYSPAHKTAISSKPNGDWYLKATDTKVEDYKVDTFVKDLVWKVKVNDDGTYSFFGAFNEDRSITVWPSGNYAELSVNYAAYPDNTWKIDPASTKDCWYISSPTVSGSSGPAYIEAYLRNGTEVFSGYFTSPSSSRFTEAEFALQFYLVNSEDALDDYDDGEWDGVLNKGDQYVMYNPAAASVIGLWDPANYSMKAIPAEIIDDKTAAGNGAYVFTVDSMGRYYTFESNGKFLATNNDEELFLIEPKEDGTAPETAKWFLKYEEGTEDGTEVSGYIVYNKEANYNGTPVCIEYFSSVFSGWTFSTRNPLSIFVFNFYQLSDEAIVHDGIVQAPSIKFDCENYRYVEQDFDVELSLDDLADSIDEIAITWQSGSKEGTVTDYSGNNRTISFTIPAADIDSDEKPESFTITVTVTNSYGITYSDSIEIAIIDEPFLTDFTPAPNSQTGDELRPEIFAMVHNAGQDPEVKMEVGGEEVEAVFENGRISYTPEADLPNGRTEVKVTAVRADGKTVTETWYFTAGYSDYQLYFGQLHSHTTYSDGSGSLDTALDYVASLPESANVDFVAFTDHSNYFDTTSAANPPEAMNDASLMTEASGKLWAEYKDKVANFNEKQNNIVAIAGFEMTWSGGPGHINSFNTQGLVSRNNAALNNKSGDAGMKLYYQTMNNDSGETMHQFNHPGDTFGNFTDFSYWDEQTDDHMFLVEVGNGEGQIGAGGYYPSYEQYTLALDQGWHVGPTNNQDNHKGRWGNANDARDVVLTNDFSEEGIYDAIRARRIYATEDKNLEMYYTLNGNTMGAILEDLDPSEKINIEVILYDPDNSDSTAKAEVIVDSGKVAYTWDDREVLAEGRLTAELDPQYTYYYIRVTQADGDLAVTAPVWTGKAAKIGISDVTYTPEQPLVNEEVTLSTEFYNEEYPDALVKSIVYTVDGSKVIGTDTQSRTIEGEGTLTVPFTFTPDTAKRITVNVTAVIDYEGRELTVTKEVTISVRNTAGDLPVTPIAEVQAVTETGYEFAIEGIVTSNASGYDKDTAFFDCIYVEDETGGICCFPVSGEFKIGDKVHIEGYTDFYQGEAELQVESIKVIGSGTVEPKKVTAAQINDLSVLGSLVTLEGTVVSVEKANDLIQTIMVEDAAGDVARVFIDGYITTAKEVENCEAGAYISATGLSSYDDTWPDTDHFARIRIRDRADVVCTSEMPDMNITVTAESEEMPIGTTQKVTVEVSPETADQNVIWSSSDETVATVDEAGTVTAVNYGKVTITATSASDQRVSGSVEIQTRFKDVLDPETYFYEPVYWAADNGITVGTLDGGFSPDANCTRAQIVTFLWRLEGEPEVDAEVPFADVAEDKYYYKAVAWAYATGVTTGTSPTKFSPDKKCVRSQIVTFLYRAMGEPEVSAEIPFDDVAEGTYYYDAVVWAYANNVTTGTKPTKFSPDGNCTRKQAVTFLYRAAHLGE